MSNKTENKSLSFEETLAQLEDIVETMEKGELPLEDALSAFEKGINLTQAGHEKLKNAEQKVQILMDNNGKQALVDFENESEADAD